MAEVKTRPPMSRNRVVTLIVFGLLAAGCEREVAVPQAPSEPSPARNLIVVSLDTLRADRLGCYGYPRPTTPALDALAAAGARFEQAYAPSPWTKPSHASLLTGLYPSRNAAVSMVRPMSDDAVHLASWLKQRGFRTAAVVNSLWLTKDGLERDFEDLIPVPHFQGSPQSSPVSDFAIRWLERRDTQRPFFLLVHYFDVHSDYASLPEYEQMFAGPYGGPADGSTAQLWDWVYQRVAFGDDDFRHLSDLYDAGVRQLDDQLARLFDFIGEQGLLEDTLLVVTADHGEEFADHGSLMHGHTQYEEMVRVPLIFRGPGVSAGLVSDTPVSLVDVMPTALARLGLGAPEDLDGVRIDPLWWDPAATLDPRLLFFEADNEFPPARPGPLPLGPKRAVRDGRYKLHFRIDTRSRELFDLEQDPDERVDVADAHPEVVARLMRGLYAFMTGQAAPTEPRELTEDELRVLKSLGYLGG